MKILIHERGGVGGRVVYLLRKKNLSYQIMKFVMRGEGGGGGGLLYNFDANFQYYI